MQLPHQFEQNSSYTDLNTLHFILLIFEDQLFTSLKPSHTRHARVRVKKMYDFFSLESTTYHDNYFQIFDQTLIDFWTYDNFNDRNFKNFDFFFISVVNVYRIYCCLIFICFCVICGFWVTSSVITEDDVSERRKIWMI